LITTTHTPSTAFDSQNKADVGSYWRNTDFCQVYLDINPQSCTFSTYYSADGATLPREPSEPTLERDLLGYLPYTNPAVHSLEQPVLHGLQHQNFGSSKGFHGTDAPAVNGYPSASPHMHPSPTQSSRSSYSRWINSLYQYLAHQLSILRSQNWHFSDLVRITCCHDVTPVYQCISNSECPQHPPELPITSSHSPLANVANSISSFTQLLWTIKYHAANSPSSSFTATNASPPSYPNLIPGSNLTFSDLHKILSIHATILSIHSLILSRIPSNNFSITDNNDNNDNNNNQTNQDTLLSECVPQLFLANIPLPIKIPSMCRVLLGYLLSNLTESQLKPVEELLGLPEELRIFWQSLSDREHTSNADSSRGNVTPESENGLFGGEMGREVLKIIWEGVDEERTGKSSVANTNEAGQVGEGDGNGVLRAVEELREEMRKIREEFRVW